jgi:hypothetical protein
VNRRAIAVLLVVIFAALAVTIWLAAEQHLAEATSGPPPAAR